MTPHEQLRAALADLGDDLIVTVLPVMLTAWAALTIAVLGYYLVLGVVVVLGT